MAELYHYGIKRRSGRYPYGSGKKWDQSAKNIVNDAIDRLDNGLIKKGIIEMSREGKQAYDSVVGAIKAKNLYPNKNITIYKARKEDAEDIMNIFESITPQEQKFLAYSNKKSLIRQVIKSERHCYVATKKGKIVGFMRESGRPGNFSLLEEIVVDPNYRNQGIATQLLDHYHKEYPKNMAKTNAANQAMISLLKKNGYKAENPNAPKIINWIRDKPTAFRRSK